jgi:hypothetical protein
LYAQGNTSSVSGGNLAIGTTTSSKVVNIFAGGATNTSTSMVITNPQNAAWTSKVNGEVEISSSNGHGGANYGGIMTWVNASSGATNPNKYIRLNATGGIEIINSAYSAVIASLDDSGDLITVTVAQNNSNAPAQNQAIRVNSIPPNSAYGTGCALDNVNCQFAIVSGTTLQPQISAVSGSYSCYTAGWYSISGYALGGYDMTTSTSISAGTWTNLPGLPDNTASGGDTVYCILTDNTNNRCYRIQWIHGGTTKGAITIERIA